MKSAITLILAGIVLFISGTYFGWWNLPVPGAELIPSYEQKKNASQAARNSQRKINGLAPEGEGGESNTEKKEHVGRRADALKNGGGVN